MALYKTHTKFNLIIALPIVIYFLCCTIHPKTNYLITFSLSFVYSTLFMNPDMDVANKIKLFSFRGIMTLPFRLYSIFFSHRGLSHRLIIGTFTRILFLSLLFVAIMALIDYSFNSKIFFMNFYYSYKKYIIYGFFGIFLADFCHLLLDLKK